MEDPISKKCAIIGNFENNIDFETIINNLISDKFVYEFFSDGRGKNINSFNEIIRKAKKQSYSPITNTYIIYNKPKYILTPQAIKIYGPILKEDAIEKYSLQNLMPPLYDDLIYLPQAELTRNQAILESAKLIAQEADFILVGSSFHEGEDITLDYAQKLNKSIIYAKDYVKQ